MGQPKVAFGIWRNQNRPIFRDCDELMGQHRCRDPRRFVSPGRRRVKKPKSRLARNAGNLSKIREERSDFSTYGMVVKKNDGSRQSPYSPPSGAGRVTSAAQ